MILMGLAAGLAIPNWFVFVFSAPGEGPRDRGINALLPLSASRSSRGVRAVHLPKQGVVD